MIYVVLGLAILVVSFVVALVSLVREQNLQAKKVTGGSTESGNANQSDLQQSFGRSSEVASEGRDWQVSATYKTREFNPDKGKREPFPWEIKDLKNEEPGQEEGGLASNSDKSARLKGEFSVSKMAAKLES